MSSFFKIYTETPWDNLQSNQLAEVRLLSLKDVFNKFPIIQPEFFDDLISNAYNNKQYSWIESIKRIVGPNNEDYDISNWNFVWAMDSDRRMYQFLFQKVKKKEGSKGILAAMAPPELAKLFSKFQKKAIIKTLSLLNNPEKIKFLMILAPKGKSIAEEQQVFPINRNYLDKLRYSNILKQMPNIGGDWFPVFDQKCPVCNELLTPFQDYKVGFGKLVCPRCGYSK